MFDLIIKNGQCYGGDGAEPFAADIGVRGGRIAAIGGLGGAQALRVIDAAGLAVSPGFIDTHSHSDLVALAEPEIANKTTQGITTDIIGQDGMSPAPVTDGTVQAWSRSMAGLEGSYNVDWSWRNPADYLKRLDAQPLGPNLAWLAPYGNLRMCVLGLENRRATKAEIGKMMDLLEESIDAGACGMSTGLVYPPGSYADEAEMGEVTKVLAKYGLPFVVHQRSESDYILDSMDEVFRVGRASGCPIHFSHFKVGGVNNAPLFDQVIAKVEAAAREMPVSFDQYPYTAGSTMLGVILPLWAHDGGSGKCLERLASRTDREKMKKDILSGLPGWDNFIGYSGIENIYVTFVKYEKNRDAIGKNLVQLGEMRGLDPMDAAFDLLLEEEMTVGMYHFYGTEEHIERIMAHPLQNACTDGILGVMPHPRVYGAFPRILGHYVRERKIMPLKTAIHKMSGRQASIFKLKDRGLLKEGYVADITVFDPETVADRATYENPRQFSAGIPYVIVGGRAVVDSGRPVPGKAGIVIRFSKY